MRPEQRKDLGAKLYLARRIKNYTQQQVAMRLNISQAHYQKIEAGKVGVDFIQLFALSQMYEIGMRECLQLIVGEPRTGNELLNTENIDDIQKRMFELKKVAEEELQKRDELITKLRKDINRLGEGYS